MAQEQLSGRTEVIRCGWAKTVLSREYHDAEWGVPVHDDRRLFEFVLLEGAQAGLSWETILKRREGYRGAFADFDPRVVARFDQRKRADLLADSGIVRNRLKIEGAISNAKIFVRLQDEFGSFDAFIWRFAKPSRAQHHWRRLEEVPAQTEESVAMSTDLGGRGFKFVGPTICYAFMQAVGMVNDHVVDCFRHREIAALSLTDC